MKIGSLFSGYGGLDLAVEAVTGGKVVWHCEWDDAPSKVLAARYPGVPNYRDVSKVDWSQVEPVDVLTGDRKSTRLNSSHLKLSRMPSSA